MNDTDGWKGKGNEYQATRVQQGNAIVASSIYVVLYTCMEVCEWEKSYSALIAGN